jgi:hypothetical protein
MAKRLTQRQQLAVKMDSLTDSEVQELLDYITIMESMRRSEIAPATWDEDVVALLADEVENRRARQAFEWETVRRRAERRLSASPGSRT